MTGYPLLLRLDGRDVLVVGAGAVAARRLPGLRAAGARVTVVAPVVSAGIDDDAVVVRRRGFVDEDVLGAALVLACTDVPAVNEAVHRAARRVGVLCLRADDRGASDAWVPAVLRRGDVVVAVSAGGAPARARALRDRVAALLDAPAADRGGQPGDAAARGDGPGGLVTVRAPTGGPGSMTVDEARALARADVVVLHRQSSRDALVHAAPAARVVEAAAAVTGGGPALTALLSTLAEGLQVVVVQAPGS